ncbi:c-type cytochrome [Flavobacterium selenitireducens]|uniref:c-type cytochrome n=1 Tax=Flavobacterium selenitireducens TaxID=2722704 RepID=UPI00168A5CCF|nr:c-type cytochrome [Flavobacterium selenitireducens]MBD3582359.1 c-type cytochrome [Flavobacterium selenitireducens]
MKKVGNHNSILKTLFLSLALILTSSSVVLGQDAAPAAATAAPAEAAAAPAGAGDPVNGKALFNTNCAACHKMDAKSTGPALRGVGDKHSMTWLYDWIHNSSAMIKAGDPVAVKLFEENNRQVMTPFPQLSNKDIDDIIAYTSQPKAETPSAAGTVGPPGTAGVDSGISNNVILGALVVVLLILVAALVMANRVLTKIAAKNGIEPAVREKTLPIWVAFARNQFLVLVTSIFLLLAAGYFFYGWTMQVGVDQEYEPIQPIHYSHRIHAGSNGIDCKYCHSAARTSKNAGIPSLNVCMNCHKNIAEVSDKTATAEHSKAFYDGEIQKLYDAVGWDKTAQKYTGKTRPVKWVRIHNLPDFVYFNHSQHVTVAGIECQTCHGPVQTFELMKQFSPLTMGWCVNCHRETNVKMEGNEYYTKIHEQLAKKYGVDKLTAAQMGGLECGKCHY